MSSPFPSCFRPSHTRRNGPPLPAPPGSSNPNLTTYLYHTDTGLVTLTWSRSILGRSLHVQVHNHNPFDSPSSTSSSSPSSSSFQLHIKPFIFWKKHGSKTLSSTTRLFWNLSKAKFSSSFSPEPHSSFYLALVVHNRIVLLLGDSPKDAYSKSKALHANNPHSLLLKKEHVFADTVYSTTAIFGGKTRRIQIDCGSSRDNDSASSKLSFSVDGDRVLQIKRLKWKFRGNERVEIDGVPVQISWDVYNWLFDKDSNGDGHAIFMFKFEADEHGVDRNVVNPWAQQNWNLGLSGSCDWAKMSSSSVSVGSSAGSFGGSSSVLEWSSVEENELVDPIGFSLIVYAWKR
ncbi:uncharacterized protein LOC130956316 [Arachis stenosperma]|uniref:uncharacterized protein LOC130956316 n=1 Tax=Arachis stenosperma TaxID=217475 RepID=UPI0025AC444E|nr:uncharacterized protein LOC130956316 [Arachis stenosperma]